MKRNPLTLAIGLVLLTIFFLLLFVFQVRQTEVAVVTTFGKFTGSAEAGAHLKWPWPFQKVYKFDRRVHILESKYEQVLTIDGYSLMLMVYIGWNISEPELFFPAFGDSVGKAEESLEGLLRNTYSSIVGQEQFASFISTDRSRLRFTQMEQEMLRKIQENVSQNKYGVTVQFLGIKKLGLPESVTKLVFDRMRSERQVLVSQIQYEGERQASDIRSAADLEAAKVIADADAEATRIVGLGAKQALKSFEVFEQNPELARFLLDLKALEAFLKEKSTLVLDRNTPPLHLLQLPAQPKASQ